MRQFLILSKQHMSLLKSPVGTKVGVLRKFYTRRGRAELQKQYPDLTESDIHATLADHAPTLKEATIFLMFPTWIDRDLRKKSQESE